MRRWPGSILVGAGWPFFSLGCSDTLADYPSVDMGPNIGAHPYGGSGQPVALDGGGAGNTPDAATTTGNPTCECAVATSSSTNAACSACVSMAGPNDPTCGGASNDCTLAPGCPNDQLCVASCNGAPTCIEGCLAAATPEYLALLNCICAECSASCPPASPPVCP
jgi:hypothetical protein